MLLITALLALLNHGTRVSVRFGSSTSTFFKFTGFSAALGDGLIESLGGIIGAGQKDGNAHRQSPVRGLHASIAWGNSCVYIISFSDGCCFSLKWLGFTQSPSMC